MDFESVKEKVNYITPVPGGVGPMTIAMLMKQTTISCQRRNINLGNNNFSRLNILSDKI